MLIRLLGLWVAETGGAGVKWGVGGAFWVETKVQAESKGR